jgi:hypothetical protein
MNPALWEELERWAADEFRSVNGQIEYLLQQAVDERRGDSRENPRPPAPSPGGRRKGEDGDQ